MIPIGWDREGVRASTQQSMCENELWKLSPCTLTKTKTKTNAIKKIEVYKRWKFPERRSWKLRDSESRVWIRKHRGMSRQARAGAGDSSASKCHWGRESWVPLQHHHGRWVWWRALASPVSPTYSGALGPTKVTLFQNKGGRLQRNEPEVDLWPCEYTQGHVCVCA